ncbi:MAG: PLP-dependent aminotransferase family protein [Ectothiorhodospiraceae bacterium]|nr:PLP-dependent aminotransferase family protein [Ectothiorhodospiraceae bacterium]
MSGRAFDFGSLFAPGPAPAAGRFSGFPRYNFVGGHNDPDAVPVDDLIAAASSVLAREGRTLATYGLQSGPQGYRPLREFICRKVAARGEIQCGPDDILVTSGSLQGLDLVNEVLLQPGDTVLTEQLTYGGALTRLARKGVEVVGIPLDEEGLRVDALRATLEELRRRGVRPKFLYTIPTVQNPTGAIMGLERRRAVLAAAAEYDIAIFEDECYADLVWSGERPPALRALDTDGRVVHIGSFSKSIAPALRTGYVVADWPVMSRLLACKSDGGSAALEQMVLAEFCARHFDAHVETLNQGLQVKLQALVDALGEQFGTAAEFTVPPGGIFLWLTLPAEVDTAALAPKALAEGIAYNPGPEWSTDAAPARHSLRLCFAHPSVEAIRDGVARLAEVCRRETGVPERIANVDRS